MGRAVFAGALTIRQESVNGTVQPGQVANLGAADGIYAIGGATAQGGSDDTNADGSASLDSEIYGLNTVNPPEVAAHPAPPMRG